MRSFFQSLFARRSLPVLRIDEAAVGAAGRLVTGGRRPAGAELDQRSRPLQDVRALVHDVPHLQEAGHRDVVDDVIAHDAELTRVGRV